MALEKWPEAYKETLEKFPEDQNNWLRRREDWSDEMEENSFLLLESLKKEDFGSIEYLLDKKGANPNFKDGIGQNALHLAAWHRCRPDLFEKILYKVDNVNEGDRDGDTALITSVYNGEIDCVVSLMKHPEIDMDVKNHQNNFALSFEIQNVDDDLRMLKQLLSVDYKINSSLTDMYNVTPLQAYKVRHGIAPNQEVIQLLTDKGEREKTQQLTTWEKYGGSDAPLCAALRERDEMSSWYLVEGQRENRIDIDKVDENGMNALHAAVKYGCIPVLFNKILSRIRNVNAVTPRHQNALHLAVYHKRLYELKKLLYVIDFNIPDMYNKTPMEYAIELGRRQCIPIFINHKGFDINVQDKNGRTVLHYAVEYDKPKIMKQLLNGGADCNIKDKKGKTPLEYAIIKGCFDCMGVIRVYMYDHARVKQPGAQKLKHKYNLRF